MEAERQDVKACPRCGDRFDALRRFTRWGRTVVILLCRSCGYAAYEETSPHAAEAPASPKDMPAERGRTS